MSRQSHARSFDRCNSIRWENKLCCSPFHDIDKPVYSHFTHSSFSSNIFRNVLTRNLLSIRPWDICSLSSRMWSEVPPNYFVSHYVWTEPQNNFEICVKKSWPWWAVGCVFIQNICSTLTTGCIYTLECNACHRNEEDHLMWTAGVSWLSSRRKPS
jgi:hypothetical protein